MPSLFFICRKTMKSSEAEILNSNHMHHMESVNSYEASVGDTLSHYNLTDAEMTALECGKSKRYISAIYN